MDADSVAIEPWEQLEGMIGQADPLDLAEFVRALPPEDTAYTIDHLPVGKQTQLFTLLADADPDLAADVIEHFADEQAADLLDDLEPDIAAAIVDEMDSDEQTDVLGEFEDEYAEAVLQAMTPEEAIDARRRLDYPEDTAGGLMITEILAYRDDWTVDQIVSDLRRRAEDIQDRDYEGRYLYLVDAQNKLTGVARLRSLLLAPPGPSRQVMREEDLLSVEDDWHVDDLQSVFERADYSALPVVDQHNRLIGSVRRAAVEEAIADRSDEQLLKFGGIIAGEELRSMPLMSRCARRLMFLVPNILLFMMSVSVIALFEPIIAKVTALAIFLPLVGGMSGASANQSVAVSIREMALGLVRPPDVGRVMAREVSLGAINGVILGMLLACVALLFDGQWALGLIVGCAFAANSVIAVTLGATMPLVLKRLGIDPAMASSPIVATLTDMAGFFFVLSLAWVMMGYLVVS